MPNEPFAIQVQWDAAGLHKFDRYLETHEGRAMERNIDNAMGRAIRPLGTKLRAAELASGIVNHTKRLYRGVKVRRLRKRSGEVSAWSAGATGPVAHLVIPGHEIVTPGGRDTGRRSRAFPFVDPVIEAEAAKLQAQLSSDVWAASTIK